MGLHITIDSLDRLVIGRMRRQDLAAKVPSHDSYCAYSDSKCARWWRLCAEYFSLISG